MVSNIKPFNFNSTSEIKIPKKLVDHIVGQESSINLIKKVAKQRRHILLIGEPGTGKSLIGQALSGLLPNEKLVDVLSIHNPQDDNLPLIKTMPKGGGKNFVQRLKLQTMSSSKGQNILFFILLIFAVIYKKVSGKTKINDKYWFGLFFTISFSVIMITFQKHLPLIGNFNEISASFFRYFLKNIDPELISLSSKTYWGILSFDNWISLHLLEIVWFIQFFSILGLILFIFSKNKPEFLPEKKYIFFFILMIVALQAGIRLADWQYFTKYGKLGLQTPGRYFFPNIAIHITLVFVGLGMLLQYFKKEKFFDLVLALSLVSMLAFFMYHLLSTLLDFYL